jgi:hypothetical protein
MISILSPERLAIDDEKINDNLRLLQSTVNGFLKIGIKPQQ